MLKKKLFKLEKRYDRNNKRWVLNFDCGNFHHMSVGLTKADLNKKFSFIEHVMENLEVFIEQNYVLREK